MNGMKMLAGSLLVAMLSAGAALAAETHLRIHVAGTDSRPIAGVHVGVWVGKSVNATGDSTSTTSTPPTTDTTSTTASADVQKADESASGEDLEKSATARHGKRRFALVTDAKGNARCSVPTGHRIVCVVHAPGYLPWVAQRTFQEGEDFGLARLQLAKPGHGHSRLLEWRVGKQDEPGEDPGLDTAKFQFHVKYYRDRSPIAGAKIELTGADGAEPKSATTDEKGEASFDVPEGKAYKAKVTADGYASYTTALAPGAKASSREVNVLLRKK